MDGRGLLGVIGLLMLGFILWRALSDDTTTRRKQPKDKRKRRKHD